VLAALARVMLLLAAWVRAAWRSTLRMRRTPAAACKKSHHRSQTHLGWSALPRAGEARRRSSWVRRPVAGGAVALAALLLATDTALRGAGWGGLAAALLDPSGRHTKPHGAAAAARTESEVERPQRFRTNPRVRGAERAERERPRVQ
jgi:hypothetical protein